MNTFLLNAADFKATFSSRGIHKVAGEEETVINIWPYVEAIPESDLAGFYIDGSDVECVYRTSEETSDHVLIPTRTSNVFLVVVIDLRRQQIHGHRLLNLNIEYGLPTPNNR